MKKIIGGLLLLSSLATAAQATAHTGIDSTDIRLVKKTKELLPDYVPAGKQGLYFASYIIGVDSFLQKLDAFKAAAHAVLDKSATPAYRALAKKDIDIFCVNVLYNYTIYYGTDSVKQVAYYKMMEEGKLKADSNYYFYKAMHVRQLPQEQHRRLDSLCFNVPDINDSALFVFSADYRKYLSDVLQHAMYKRLPAGISVRPDRIQAEQMLARLKAANDLISNPHIRNYFIAQFTGSIIKMVLSQQFAQN